MPELFLQNETHADIEQTQKVADDWGYNKQRALFSKWLYVPFLDDQPDQSHREEEQQKGECDKQPQIVLVGQVEDVEMESTWHLFK